MKLRPCAWHWLRHWLRHDSTCMSTPALDEGRVTARIRAHLALTFIAQRDFLRIAPVEVSTRHSVFTKSLCPQFL